MAVHRIPVKCNNCDKFILLRIVIAGGEQPFLLPCPHCHVEQHGWFYAEPEGPYQFRSDDLSLEDEESSEGLGVMVATDMPVHSRFYATPLPDIFRSPFFDNVAAIGNSSLEPLMGRIEKLREIRRSWHAPLRRVASHYSRQDEVGMRQALASTPGGKGLKWSERDPFHDFEVLVAQIFNALEDEGQRHAADVELLKLAKMAVDQHESELRELIGEFETRYLPEHRARTVDAAFSAFRDPDSLYPALWVEAMIDKVDLGDYRVMRDDYNTLKVLYQDLFELGSRSLTFTAPIANLAKRGDIRKYADGISRSLNKARKERAVVREGWLDDFPEAKKLYGAVSRSTRNDFGHALVRYDPRSGDLVFDDGRQQNYLMFLLDLLSAIRLSHYLLDVIYIIRQIRLSLEARDRR